jgi:hypothetical protein
LLAQQNGGEHRAQPSRLAHVRAASHTHERNMFAYKFVAEQCAPNAPIESSIDSAHSSGKYPTRWT